MERPSDVWLVQTLGLLGLGEVFFVKIDTDRVGRSDQTDHLPI